MHPTDILCLLLPLLLLGAVPGSPPGGVVRMEKWASGGGVGVGSVLFQEGVVSVVDCAARCVSMPTCRALATAPGSPPSLTCRGYGYPPITTITSTTSTTPAATTTSTAYSNIANPWRDVWILDRSEWLKAACSSGPDCGGQPLVECVDGSCLCSPGYYYSLSHDACVQTCASEHLQHTRFLEYPGWRITSNNVGKCHHNVTLENCLQQCTSTVHVRTCDYARTKTSVPSYCCLQSLTKLDVNSSKWDQEASTTHYQKMCV